MGAAQVAPTVVKCNVNIAIFTKTNTNNMNNLFKVSIASFAFLFLVQCSPTIANKEDKCNQVNNTEQSVTVKSGEKIVNYEGRNSSNILVNEGGNAVRIDLCDSATANIKGGTSAHINMYDSSDIKVSGNSEITHLTFHEDSKGEISGGSFSFINLKDKSDVRIKSLKLQDGSTSLSSGKEISGGVITLQKGATLHIYGESLNFSNGKLSGVWADGTKFNIWLLQNSQGQENRFKLFQSMPKQVVFHKVEKPVAK